MQLCVATFAALPIFMATVGCIAVGSAPGACRRLKSAAKRGLTLVSAETRYEMKVIIGEQGNNIFIPWLKRIQKEIERKSYSKKRSL